MKDWDVIGVSVVVYGPFFEVSIKILVVPRVALLSFDMVLKFVSYDDAFKVCELPSPELASVLTVSVFFISVDAIGLSIVLNVLLNFIPLESKDKVLLETDDRMVELSLLLGTGLFVDNNKVVIGVAVVERIASVVLVEVNLSRLVNEDENSVKDAVQVGHIVETSVL